MKWLLALLALILMLLLAVANAPASLIPMALEQARQHQLIAPGSAISLTDLSGTIWQGQSANATLTLQYTELELGQLSWQLEPMSLLQQSPVLQLLSNHTEQTIKATVNVSMDGLVSVSDLEGRMPISVLEPWMPLLIKGDMAFVIDQLVFNATELQAVNGVLNLEYVDWLGGDRDMPLGSYLAQIGLEQKDVHVQINDFSALLGIDGLLAISPSGAYHFKATLEPRQGLAPEIAETINWLGKKNIEGNILINSRGKF